MHTLLTGFGRHLLSYIKLYFDPILLCEDLATRFAQNNPETCTDQFLIGSEVYFESTEKTRETPRRRKPYVASRFVHKYSIIPINTLKD